MPNKTLDDVDVVNAIAISINDLNQTMTDFRKDLTCGVFKLSDVLASAVMTFDKHDRDGQRVMLRQEDKIINHLTGEVVEEFVIFDDRQMKILADVYFN